jgi:hypothetical protein
MIGASSNTMPAMDTLVFLEIGKNAIVFYMNSLYLTSPDARIASFAFAVIPLNDTIIHNLFLSAMEIFVH